MRDRTCCFTGHRRIPPEQVAAVSRRLDAVILSCIEKGYRYFGTGGALGFDTLAAQSVIKWRKTYPHIRLILVLPCRSQAAGWPAADRAIYESIKQQADKVVYTAEHYTAGCMHRRNRHLVDHSSLCISYLTQTGGGSFYTVQYARGRGVEVVNIAEMQP